MALLLGASLSLSPSLSPSLPAQDPDRVAGREEREDPMARDEAFWRLRTYPFESISATAYLRAREQAARMPQLDARLVPAPRGAALAAAQSPLWQSMGPRGLLSINSSWSSMPHADEGRVLAIAIDPTTPSTIYAGSASGGIWKSTSAGAIWSPLTDDACSLSASALVLDPVNPAILYAGTGELSAANTGRLGCGLLRSTNGGATWTNLGRATFQPSATASAAQFTHLLVDRTGAGSSTTSTVFAATSSGLWRSRDAGESWTRVLTGVATAVVQHPTKAEIFYAAIGAVQGSPTNGVYRSTDGGASWSAIGGVGAPSGFGRMELAISAAQPEALWVLAAATTGNGATFGGLWRFDAAPGTWTSLAAANVASATGTSTFGTQSWYNLVLGVDPVDPARIFVGGVRLFRSTDGGASFRMVTRWVHADWHALVFDPRTPQTIIAGNDGGVHASYDGGESWVGRNTGLSLTQFYPGISVHPTSPSIVLGGLQDNGSVLSQGLPTWNGVGGGDGGFTAMNPQNPNVIYVESQWDGGPSIFRRNAVGSPAWSARNTGIITTDRAQFIPPLVMSPLNPNVLYFGTQRLYRTSNEGQLWQPSTASDLSNGSGSITTIAPSATDSLIVWVGTNDGQVQLSLDGGITFTNRSTGLPNRSITRLALDPTNPARAIATVSGLGTGHVWLTTNQGTTWTNISGNLPDIPTTAVSLITGTAERIIAGTDVGVFATSDGGATWGVLGAGLPNVFVMDLRYHAPSGLLIAATHGRGIWGYQLGPAVSVLRGDLNGDGMVNAADALLAQQALTGIALPAGVFALPAGDANCDGVLTAADPLIILRFSAGLPVTGSCVNTNR